MTATTPDALPALPETAAQFDAMRDALGGRPILCFANDWNGDPTSKHHIMRTYARVTDVVWVEASGMRRPNLANPLDLKRIVKRLRRSAGGVQRSPQADRLRVLAPASIPLPGNPIATRVNAALYRRSTGAALDQIAPGTPPLAWVYTPTVSEYLPRLPHRGMVYHCVDRWWEFTEYDSALMRRHHERLCRTADVVFASARALYEDCAAFTDRAHLVPHGVQWEHFAAAAFAPPPPPADVADLAGRPVVGFFGLIHDWVDQALMVRVARELPDVTVVVIGRATVDVSALRAEPNVRLLGQKPYAELPAYSALFDVSLVPFALNELTTAVNPIKLREYLSAGLPVVASALPEVRDLEREHPDVVRTAADGDAFVAAVRGFLAEPLGAERRQAIARRMLPESWPGRCAQMARLVAEAVAAPTARPR